MKSSIAILMLCLLTGCAQHNNLSPVSGNEEPVNSPAIIQELSQNV